MHMNHRIVPTKVGTVYLAALNALQKQAVGYKAPSVAHILAQAEETGNEDMVEPPCAT